MFELPDGDVAAVQAGGAFVVDVREPEETLSGSVPKSILAPSRSVDIDELSNVLQKHGAQYDSKVVVYCASGKRSEDVVRKLRDLGYSDSWTLEGGFNKWQNNSHNKNGDTPKLLDESLRGRHARQIMVPEVGTAGQKRLLSSKAIVVGAGGLGSPVVMYLSAAGLGCIGIVDDDVVELSNLNRQVLYGEGDIGLSKASAAAEFAKNRNSDSEVIVYQKRLDKDNVVEIINGCDVVVDCSDNMGTRVVLAEATKQLKIPLVHGSVYRLEGQIAVFHPELGKTTYQDLIDSDAPQAANCSEAGVLGVLPGIVGSIQALEVLKVLLDELEPLIDELLVIDGTDLTFRKFKLAPGG